MSNIVNFPLAEKPKENNTRRISYFMHDWAVDQGIDPSTRKFKLLVAGIETHIKGFLSDD